MYGFLFVRLFVTKTSLIERMVSQKMMFFIMFFSIEPLRGIPGQGQLFFRLNRSWGICIPVAG